jgi:hypothetical protein
LILHDPDYLHSCWYRPQLGQFLTQDTYEGDPEQPASLHKYLYADSDPVNRIDPFVGVESYGHELPLAGLLQDAVALPLFAGGNIGVRRRQLHALMLDPAYDDLATLDGICLAETVP